MRYFNHPSLKNTYYEFRGFISKNAERFSLTRCPESYIRKEKIKVTRRRTTLSVGIQPGSFHRYQALLEVVKKV